MNKKEANDSFKPTGILPQLESVVNIKIRYGSRDNFPELTRCKVSSGTEKPVPELFRPVNEYIYKKWGWRKLLFEFFGYGHDKKKKEEFLDSLS